MCLRNRPMRATTVVAMLASALAIAPASVVAGQAVEAPLRVIVVRPLHIGQLIAGLTAGDRAEIAVGASGAGWFEIIGQPGSVVDLVFVLPDALIGEDGQRLQLNFGPRSAAYSESRSTSDLVSFDPHIPRRLSVPAGGRLMVALGASASSPPHVQSGRFTGAVVLLAHIP